MCLVIVDHKALLNSSIIILCNFQLFLTWAMVFQFSKKKVFWNQHHRSIMMPNLNKVQRSGLHSLDYLTWNDPTVKIRGRVEI